MAVQPGDIIKWIGPSGSDYTHGEMGEVVAAKAATFSVNWADGCFSVELQSEEDNEWKRV